MTEYSNPYSSTESPGTYSDPVLSTAGTDAVMPYGVESDTSLSDAPAYETPAYDTPAYDTPLYGGADRPLPGGVDTAAQSDPSMKDKAAQSADAGKQAASAVASTAADKAKDVAAETKQQARNVVGQAQDQLREQTSAQHKNLVTNLRSLGDELTSMAQGSEQSGYATDLVGQAADRAHGAASWLDSKEPSELVDEVRRYARQKPGMFILGALVAGVAAGRLTRGVVAVHKDDAEAAPAQHIAGPSDPGFESVGYDAGYGTSAYDTTTGYAGGVAGSAPVGGIEP